MHPIKPEMFTVDAFCRTYNLGRTLTFSLLAKGEIDRVKVGSKTLIPRSSAEAFFARAAQGTRLLRGEQK